jgi:methylase of polypeptide subunit release factors
MYLRTSLHRRHVFSLIFDVCLFTSEEQKVEMITKNLDTTPAFALKIAATKMFGTSNSVQRIQDEIALQLTEHTYLPKAESPRSDWVMSVTIPAFRAYRERHGLTEVNSFCTIGTGSGTDALAAIEILAPANATLTDLHPDVVKLAVGNVQRNLAAEEATRVEGFAGDLATPLLNQKTAFDLIYENLPNIPLFEGIVLMDEQNSSSFINSSGSSLPTLVANDLLELHFVLLKQAQSLLAPGGRVLSSIGARRPVTSIVEMPRLAGFDSNVLIYTWKIQSEVEDIVKGYATHQRRGLGPFHFYPTDVLEKTFASVSPAEAAANVLEIERSLESAAIDAVAAEELLGTGIELGHTVLVLEATPHS